jgi:anti-sigma B factor antagonist
MELNREKIDEIIIIHMKGKLTISNAEDLLSELDSLINQKENKFVLDMSEIDFVDSIGLGAIVRFWKKLLKIDGQVKLSNLKPKITTMFQLTRIDNILQIYNSYKDAIKDF